MTPMSEAQARESLSAAVPSLAPYISVTAEGILIVSGYSEALARLLRWVPKAKWRTDKRAWLVPLAGADAMRSVLPEIIRLAEAAAEERRADSTQAEDQFGKDWRAALSQAAARGQEDIAALRRSAPPQTLDRDDVKTLIGGLRGDAAKLAEMADLLEAWLMQATQAR